ncbi:unnamed protein product [Phytophthora fragariaefolia]|uniref:Unnamed protein product n=1 Tax=Phytophthora fragariaefolia TaxID=1490495 RepID=A0A9W7CFL2_9STRA|nr:unnamed protein product [Phytophthora fragariaefolia]
MIDEVLQNCHNSIEGGHQGIVWPYHQVKTDYYWIGLYADVANTSNPVKIAARVRASPTSKVTRRFQRKEKARRAKEHNDALSRVEKRSIPVGAESPTEPTTTERSPAESPAESESTEEAPAEFPAESVRSLFKEGDQVWLFMERAKPGLTKKLAHRWHGPFRVKRKVEEFAYELELPDKRGYRFYPVVHVSRLKAVKELGERPTTRLRPELNETERSDFDEPEDSWEPDENANRFEVEATLDDELPLSTSTSRAQRRFKVKWVGYDEPSREPLSNLSCGGSLFDYLRTKKGENRLQMVQVADES